MRRFLALGDSYTIGEGVAPGESWPAQLRAGLLRQDIELDEPEIIAETGWTTGELAAAIKRATPSSDHAIVSLLIGVNNQYRGGLLGEYRAEFAKLLDTAIKCAGGVPKHVIVVSVPDWSVTPFAEGRDRAAIAAHIDRFNAVNVAETKLRYARYVDITALSRRQGAASYLAADGLHPSRLAYAEWARAIEPEALKALGILSR